MEEKVCQSCGMPMKEETYGSEADGSKSKDYCSYCYDKGSFTSDCSLDEMVEICIPFMEEADLPKEGAEKLLKQSLQTLKRWKTKA